MARLPRVIEGELPVRLSQTSQLPSSARRLLVSAGLTVPLAAMLPARANAQPAAARTALVIGNADYPLAPLRNPVNDARLVAATLQDIGFEVGLLENGTLEEMVAGVRQWMIRSQDAQVRAFYFAGHGTQYQGQNFLVPVDLSIKSEEQIKRGALQLSAVVQSLSAQASGVNFVIVDACRTDPTALLDRRGSRTRSLEDPLKPGFVPEVAPHGTVVAYSTSPGSLAADGVDSDNSVFTQALASQLREPGIPVESLFKRVRMSVMRATRNAQIPWEQSSLVGDFCFLPGANGQCGR
ncbi:MAG: caspase domain-containing protein [Burkholderiaceae bacterium]